MTVTDAPRSEHPALRPDSRLTPELIAQYESTGQWTSATLSSLLSDAAAERPAKIAAVDFAGECRGRREITFGELDAYVTRLATGLIARGVRPGDSVVAMLPNAFDFAALIFAINRAGAVYTGIPAAYGEKEVGHILRTIRPRIVVCEGAVASARPVEVVRASMPADAETLVVVRGGTELADGELDFSELETDATVALPSVDARGLCHVGFTSGTTGNPKGVMNTNQTLVAVMRNWVDYFGRENLGEEIVNAVVSPIGHHSGFLWGVLLSTYLRAKAVYLDKWSPQRAADMFRTERATMYFGAPTFLQDLLRTDLAGDPASPLRAVVVTGAPVPRALPAQGREQLGAWVGAAWGMTEIGIGISCRPGMSDEELATDGRSFPGVETRVVGADGAPVPAGSLGRLQVRSAGLFLGYLGLPEKTREEIDPAGWFETGDNAVISHDGLIRLDGRSKDIIIRGGENIPVVAVESALYSHPDVVDVALVGVPDSRLGERACAIVVTRPGVRLTLEELNDYLLRSGVSKHFLPERLQLLDALPKTPSGKIRKVELRAALQDESSGAR